MQPFPFGVASPCKRKNILPILKIIRQGIENSAFLTFAKEILLRQNEW
jgi:hypothetical protein